MKIYAIFTSIDDKKYKYFANEELAIKHLDSIRANHQPGDTVIVDNKFQYGIKSNNKYHTIVIWTIAPIEVEE